MFPLDVSGDPHFERTIRLLQASLTHMNYVPLRSIQYTVLCTLSREISVASFPKKHTIGPISMEILGGG